MKEIDNSLELIFGEKGCLGDILSPFTPRVSQLKMAEFLKDLFNKEGTHALVEAGTGTGKTLAYLVPALHYCLREGLRLAVSTETRSLQQQLVEKDIPALKKILPGCLSCVSTLPSVWAVQLSLCAALQAGDQTGRFQSGTGRGSRKPCGKNAPKPCGTP